MLNIIKGPYLQWATPHSMTIVWETTTEATGEVICFETMCVHADGNGRFHPQEGTRRVITTAGAPSCIQRVTIPDLQPETLYHYQVRVQNSAGEVCTSELLPFKTAVNPDTPFAFAVTSETGGTCSDDYNREIFAQIERYRPDFLLMVGDSVCHGRNYTDWERYFFGPARTLLHSTPFYLCLGNHEENAPWFYDFVAYPQPKNYYAFTYGNSQFIALDSTAIVEYRDRQPYLIEGAFVPGAPQYEFLLNELRTSQATWKIVFFHYPPYVSADYQVDAMRVLCPLLEEYGVDLVFNSHTIVYERSHPIRNGKVDLAQGIVYVVAGGAGNYARWFHAKRAWHTAQALGVPHFVQVSIADRRLELQAIDYEGRLFDMLVLTKHNSGVQ